MFRRRDKNKSSKKMLSQIGPALIPAVSLTAVPRSPFPKPPSGNPLALATAIFSASFPSSACQSGDSADDVGGHTDPESSLYDYQLMEDPGYSTVEFEPVPKRKNYLEHLAVRTPPFCRRGDTHDIFGPAETANTEQDLYSTPLAHKTPARQLYQQREMSGSNGSVVGEGGGAAVQIHIDAAHTNLQCVGEVPVEECMKISKVDHISSSVHMRSDDGTMVKDMEVERFRLENTLLQDEVIKLRRVAAAVQVGDIQDAETMLQKDDVDRLKDENEILRDTVGRLTNELSCYQAKFRPLHNEDLNKRYLAPLFLAYDDFIREKEESLQHCSHEMETLKHRVAEGAPEHDASKFSSTEGERKNLPGTLTRWHELQQQATLVLEENQVLVEQADFHRDKVKDLCAAHIHEVSQLSKRLAVSESEKEELECEVEAMRKKLKDIRQQQHSSLACSSGNVCGDSSHNMAVSAGRSVSIGQVECLENGRHVPENNFQDSGDGERQKGAALELAAENKQLHAEVKVLKRGVRQTHHKLSVLQRAVQQSESQELVTQNELANVIKIVEKTMMERDTASQMVKEQQRDFEETVSRLVGNGVQAGKTEQKLKAYRIKAYSALGSVTQKLKEQDDAFNSERREYRREIGNLRVQVKEREEQVAKLEGAKKSMEEDLENVWQSATTENRCLKNTLLNTVFRLKDHPSLRRELLEQDELDDLIKFSLST